MISIYSVFTAIIFYNVSLLILFLLRRKTKFMAQYAISTLLFLALLSIIRLLSPMDLDFAYIVRSERVIPGLLGFLDSRPFGLPLSVGQLVLVVWFGGTLFYILRTVRAEVKAYKARKLYPCIKSEQVQRVLAAFEGRYNVKISPKVSQAYTVGIIRPVVYLPYIKLSDEELYFVLLHEIQHIKSHDNLKRLLFLLIEAVFWWNPLAHISVGEFEMLIEIQCDAKVSARMDSDTLKKYLHTMLTFIKLTNPAPEGQTPELATSFAQTYSIKQRFEVLLLRKSRKPRHIRLMMCAVFLLCFLLSYCVIFQAYYESPDIGYGKQYTFASVNSYILNSDGIYLLISDGQVVDVLTEDVLSKAPYDSLTIVGG